MPNVWKQFQALLPQQPLQIGEVVSVNADGTSTVETPAGALLRVRGDNVAQGSNAYIRGGELVGEAPDLAVFQEVV